MPTYLVETYLARCRAGERDAHEARAHAAAEGLARAGTRVSFDGVIHVPDDETCFFVFVAPSEPDAAAAARLAGLDAVRVVEAVASWKE